METKRFRNHFSDVIEQLGGLLIFLFIVGVQSIPDILSDTDGDSNDIVALIDNPKYAMIVIIVVIMVVVVPLFINMEFIHLDLLFCLVWVYNWWRVIESSF